MPAPQDSPAEAPGRDTLGAKVTPFQGEERGGQGNYLRRNISRGNRLLRSCGEPDKQKKSYLHLCSWKTPAARAGSKSYCGSMFSGKTEELIRRLKRAKFAHQQVEIFKPRIDVRYSEEEVVSHDANAIRSTPVESAAEHPADDLRRRCGGHRRGAVLRRQHRRRVPPSWPTTACG